MKCDQLILGNIVTYDTDAPYVPAMAVKDGRIAYIGTEELARKLCDEHIKVLDYGTATVYPGFVDAHCHGLMAGQRLAFECDLTPGNSMEEYCEILRKYIEKYPDRSCYKGAGWFKHAEPTAAMLDAVCADKAVILNSADAHSMWVNTKALEEAGITAELAKQKGYDLIHVDENGNPSGLLCETGTSYVRNLHPNTVEELKEALLAWQAFAFQNGLTSAGEAMADMCEGGMEAYEQLDREGKWKLRTFAYPGYSNYITSGRFDEIPARFLEDKKRCDSDHFNLAGCKIILDGVVEAHTAYLDDGYTDQPEYHGVLNVPDPEVLNRYVLLLNRAGIPVQTHAIGDGAIRLIMDAYEKAELDTCNFDIRNIVCHLQCVHKEDFIRFGAYHVIACVAPLWVPVEPDYFKTELGFLGEERAWHEYPIRSFADTGTTVVFHTDYPVSPNINPSEQLYAAVKRAASSRGPASVKNPEEGISIRQALLACTANCAYMWRKERELGTFAIGKWADCTVFDKDFLKTEDLNRVGETKLIATIVDGEEVYRA